MENIALDFKKLPSDVRKHLIELQNAAGERFVFAARPSPYNWLVILAGVVWCVYMFSATQNYLWKEWMFWIFAAVSAILIPAAVFSLINVLAAKFSKFKSGFIFTPAECLKINGNCLEFWRLQELEGFQLREDLKLIEIWIDDRLEKIRSARFDEAQRLEGLFDHWRKTPQPTFLSDYARPEYAFKKSSKIISMAGGAVLLIGLSFAVSYAANLLNRRYDDDLTWKRTEKSELLGDYEAYKTAHPFGRHASEADRRMTEILTKLKDAYTQRVKQTADQGAVGAFAQILEKIGRQPKRTIYVKIRENRELDEAVVKRLKQETGLSVNSYDYSVPVHAAGYRREKILNDIGVLFLPATRNASINFEMSDEPPAGCAAIEIDYAITSLPLYYRFDWYSGNSISVNYNPGARFAFDFALKSAEGENLYQTNFISELTTNLNTGIIDKRDAVNYSFDKVYFSSVSEDFSKALEYKFGLRD